MKPYKILIVDDDPIVLKSTKKLLESSGYHVTIAKGGEEALEKLNKKQFDLVITELLMDNIDGMEVLNRFEQINPDGMRIILTAYGKMHTAIPSLKNYVDEFMEKPCDWEEILAGVTRCIKKIEIKNNLNNSMNKLFLSKKNVLQRNLFPSFA